METWGIICKYAKATFLYGNNIYFYQNKIIIVYHVKSVYLHDFSNYITTIMSYF